MESQLVSIVMSVYNAERYVQESIESILRQTYTNFEFLIFDDGSTDRSRDIIASFAERDKRILPSYSEKNQGYVACLNRGIKLANGHFIGRMDADDIALPERIEKQVEFLQKEPKIAIVGSSCVMIDAEGKETGENIRLVAHRDLFWQSFFTNPLAHPTVMFRKSAIVKAGFYNSIKVPSEDFDMWVRILKTSQIANLSAPLLKYRSHPMSISHLQEPLQVENSLRTIAEHWKHFFNVPISHEMAVFFRNFHKGRELTSMSVVRPAYSVIIRLYWSFVLHHGISPFVEKDAFNKLLYLALKSRKVSGFLFVQHFALLVLLFPLRLVLKLLRND